MWWAPNLTCQMNVHFMYCNIYLKSAFTFKSYKIQSKAVAPTPFGSFQIKSTESRKKVQSFLALYLRHAIIFFFTFIIWIFSKIQVVGSTQALGWTFVRHHSVTVARLYGNVGKTSSFIFCNSFSPTWWYGPSGFIPKGMNQRNQLWWAPGRRDGEGCWEVRINWDQNVTKSIYYPTITRLRWLSAHTNSKKAF